MKIKTIKYSDIMKHPHLSLSPKDYCDRCNIEILGRYTCLKCGYKWSAMMSDDEIPINCECEVDE